MFNLNKSLAKLKSFFQKNQLVEDEKTKESKQKNGKIDSSQVNIKPKQTKKNSINKTEIKNGSAKNDSKRGVIMVKNFPHGFYEKQMHDYFSQFGEVTRLKVVRSRKTGNPRNYGFIEFYYEDVAKIAAETMNNYMMFGQVMKCLFIPKEKLRASLFKNWNRPFLSTVKRHKIVHNKPKSEEQELRMVRKHLKRIHQMKTKLEEQGIQFEPVIINRPTGLKRQKKQVSNGVSKNQEVISMNSKKKLPRPLLRTTITEEIPTSSSTTLRMKKLSKRQATGRTLKFMKLRAGFRI